ncbi:MAG: c-type cytochrome [Gammaproteobacteria bacterium]|nr:c-type cytochrome [Gammaproteobacteria bacterium]MCY4255462.1 c-type cytochrome [Gammaproteobacteria bacterium]MCY4340221.1 c-type cytochrome [Gammaproteobacteria bacterium]
MISKTGRAMAAGALFAILLGGAVALPPTLVAQDAAQSDSTASRLVARGKRLYVFCQACHATEIVSGSKIGPNLAGIFNRQVAVLEDSIYSDALKAQDFVWNEEKLDLWLQRPFDLVPDTSMNFAGLPQARNRAALIAYLKTL